MIDSDENKKLQFFQMSFKYTFVFSFLEVQHCSCYFQINHDTPFITLHEHQTDLTFAKVSQVSVRGLPMVVCEKVYSEA